MPCRTRQWSTAFVCRVPHCRVKAVAFSDVTDHQNNLGSETRMVPYRSSSRPPGHLLSTNQPLTGNSVFWHKDAIAVQLAYPGQEFVARQGEFRAVGLGLLTTNLRPDGWIWGYGVVVGVTLEDETAHLLCLCAYQRYGRLYMPDRNEIVLMNTRGNRIFA